MVSKNACKGAWCKQTRGLARELREPGKVLEEIHTSTRATSTGLLRVSRSACGAS